MRVASLGDPSRLVSPQFQSGFWFKEDLTFVNIRSVLANMTLLGVRIYEFDRDLHLIAIRVAESGRFVGDGRWELENVKTTEIGASGTRVTSAPSLVWQTLLRPSILNVYQVAPERLDLNALYDNIRVLNANSQKTSRFEIAFWNKVLYPGAVLVIMVLALPFAHFQRRQGGIGIRIFVGTMLGLTFFLVGRLFSNLGLLNDWPPLFSAAFPLVFFVAVAGVMLWRIERR